MLELNAIYFVLLLEGFALLALILLAWALIAILRLRRRRRAIRDLARRFGQRAAQRAERTESFLQAVYQFEGDELRSAMGAIAKRETEFFELLEQSLKRPGAAQVGALDGALERLAEAYKCLQPRVAETPAEQVEALEQLERVQRENEKLQRELALAKRKLSDLGSEFGNLSGGGKERELELEESREKVAAMHAETRVDVKL